MSCNKSAVDTDNNNEILEIFIEFELSELKSLNIYSSYFHDKINIERKCSR